ncbi:Zinc finger, C2H2-like [Penicillium digitatum]|nr:Zinc finger, C2H2-like [Penicillium digitatum]
MTAIPIPLPPHRSLSPALIDMQSPFNYTNSYSSSPGSMDFFYSGQPVYDSLCDLDATSPFPMQKVAPELYNITSLPYTHQRPYDYPVFDRPAMPQGAPSSCGSSYSSYSSSFNFPSEEINLPSYPISEYESSADSPAPQPSKLVKPFGCDHCGKSFTRFADLKRHQSSVHYPVFRNCPVEHCSRKGSNGFPRQDHLVEHLRSYHHMDVPKRGSCKRSAKQIS